MHEIGLGLSLLSLVIWLWLLCFRGQFWRSDQVLEESGRVGDGGDGKTRGRGDTERGSIPDTRHPIPDTRHLIPDTPSICAVIPARNEADLLPVTLRSLLTQDYSGTFDVILVDDHSTDGTAEVAKETAEALGKQAQLRVIQAEPLPSGWTGKLWAMDQGVKAAASLEPNYLLLTDADIAHDGANLRRLVTQAVQQDLALISVMVRLRCESFWEKLLIPAFVFFFEKLYPFRWVNTPGHAMAAAAGGCILIRKASLEQIGGLQTIRHALIDDCALAKAVKLGAGCRVSVVGDGEMGSGEDRGDRGDGGNAERSTSDDQPLATDYRLPITDYPSKTQSSESKIQNPKSKIWLGLSDRTLSLRPYPSLKTIWDMVARTAFTQLNYSPLMLLGTLIGMTVIYLLPPIALISGIILQDWTVALCGLVGWLLMTFAYFPTVRFYRCSAVYAFCLPAIAFLYTLMTIDSALRYWQGRGGAWKGRVYE